MSSAVEIFIAYSRRDANLLEEFRIHLRPLERMGKAKIWYDGKIEPGTVWEEAIKRHLHGSDIILLLLSANALASDYFYDQEVADALARHDRGEARVVPLILRSCAWRATRLADLQAIPKDGKPVVSWPDRDNAYADAVDSLWKLIEQAEQEKQQRTAAAQREKAAEQAARQATAARRQSYTQALARARALQAQGDWAAAQQAWQQALAQYESGFPESAAALEGYLAECAAALQRRADFESHLSTAQQALRRRRWHQAIAAAQAALQAAPNDAAAQRLLEAAEAGRSAPPARPTARWAALGIGALLFAVVLWQVFPRGDRSPSAEELAATNYRQAWEVADSVNTLPVWQAFLKAYPEGEQQQQAQSRLDSLKREYDRLLNDAEALSTVDIDHACGFLREALKIVPDDPKVRKLMTDLGC